jgi:hypothetical protein
MPTQQPSLSHKKWFQTIYVSWVIFFFTLSFNGLFSGPNGYYYMAIVGSITLGFIIYSIVKRISDWKIFLIYGIIAIALVAFNYFQLK